MHGLAHVDTPKGDLDMSGSIAKPSVSVVVDNSFQYPYGTTEQFPAMEDSDLNILPQSAHYYMECSNKGTCDRDTGLCECFDGYDGVACQRASCPGYPASCSGHGVCKSAAQLASADAGNVYKLWNKDATMGCECDAGYFGPDCSQRNCKVGVDPLYLDDSSTVKYSAFDFATLTTATTADFDDGHPQQGTGYWAIRFFDHTGEDWVTEKIAAGATCEVVKAALYALPNDVIPAGTLYCTRTDAENKADSSAVNADWNANEEHKSGSGDANHDVDAALNGAPVNYFINYQMSIWDSYIHQAGLSLSTTTDLGNSVFGPSLWYPGSYKDTAGAVTRDTLSGYIYRIKFHGNPGKLREPEIVTHLDGKRNSLMSTEYTGTTPALSAVHAVITKVWTDGQQGEDKDYFADHCDGVTVGIHTDDETGVSNPKKINEITTTGKFFHLIPGRMTYDATSGSEGWDHNTDASMVDLLKKCLGDSDATSTNNVEIYDWDHGSEDYPHLIKLVRSVTSATDGGYYVAVIYVLNTDVANPDASSDNYFKILNPFIPPDAVQGDTFEVYTTKGTLSRVSRQAVAHFGFASNKVITTNIDKLTAGNGPSWDGDLSCEVGANNGFRVSPSLYTKQALNANQATMAAATIGHNGDGTDVFINDVVTEWTYDYNQNPHKRTASAHYKNCLNKTDIITFLNPKIAHQNPQHINLYTIERLVKDKAVHSNVVRFPTATVTPTADTLGEVGNVVEDSSPMHYGTNVITLDLSTNWATDVTSAATTVASVEHTYVYKFVPAAASTYEYVAECSNRGLCDRDSGTCTCFAGYTSDSCSEQSSLAI